MRVVVGAFPPVSWDNQSNSGHGLLILNIGGHDVLHAAHSQLVLLYTTGADLK